MHKGLQAAIFHDLVLLRTPAMTVAAGLGAEVLQGFLEAMVDDDLIGPGATLKIQIILSYNRGELDWNKMAEDLSK